METAFGILIIVGIIVACTWLFFKSLRHHGKQAKELKEAYEQALKSGDKQAALNAGRKYFAYLRNGNLSIYDEQRLTNDLSAMK